MTHPTPATRAGPPGAPFIPFPPDLVPARFVERPNRFLVRARLGGDQPAGDGMVVARPATAGPKRRGDDGEADGPVGETDERIVEAHLPDPGRLRELLLPDARLWLEPARNPLRRTRWTLRLCERPDGDGVVSLDTTLPNRLVEKALRAGRLQEFAGWRVARTEPTVGRSRFDFLLERDETPGEAGGSAARGGGTRRDPVREGAAREGTDAHPSQRLLLEVKSVTLVEDGVGLFPDAVTARGARHVEELAALAAEGWEAAVLFVLQRDDAREIRAAASIDPVFARALAAAGEAGLRILGRRCFVTLEGIALGEAVPAEADPPPA